MRAVAVACAYGFALVSIGFCLGHIAASIDSHKNIAAAEKRAAAYQAKDAQNYPLARQWREAYEKLAKACEVKR